MFCQARQAQADSISELADPEDAVGAFVRAISEAPADLQQGEDHEQTSGLARGMTLQGGLAQLSALKAQLEAM